MKSFLFLFLALVFFASPSNVYANFEQYIEKVNYIHINRTEGTQTLEVKKESGNITRPELNVYIWGTLSETYTQKFFKEVFPKIKEKYPQAKFIYNHRSFVFHEPKASETEKQIECIAEQSLFWQNIPLIINSQSDKINNLNLKQYRTCLSKSSLNIVLNTANEDADSFGITSVPTVIIENNNNQETQDVRIIGAQEMAVYEEGFSQVLNSKNQITSVEKKLAELEERVASAESEVQILRSEQNFLQTQIEKLLSLMESLLQNVKLV